MDLNFKHLGSTRLLRNVNSASSFLNCLCTLQQRGLVAAAQNDNTVVLFKANDLYALLRKAAQKLVQCPTAIVEFTPADAGIVSILGASCDASLLCVVVQNSQNLPVMSVYDVAKLTGGHPTAALHTAVLSSVPGVSCVQLTLNPVTPCSACACLSDGSAVSLQLNPLSVIARLQPNNVSGACSWSPKGKQIVFGLPDGQLAQFKPDLTLTRRIPSPGNNGRVVDVIWLSSFQFAVVYADSSSDSHALCIVDAPKTDPTKHTMIEEAVSTDVESKLENNVPARFFMFHLPGSTWHAAAPNDAEVLVVGSSVAVGVDVLLKQADNSWTVMDESIDPVPNELELAKPRNILRQGFLQGMAIECTDSGTVALDRKDKNYPNQPVVLYLTNLGRLACNHIIDVGKFAQPLEQPIEQTTNEKVVHLDKSLSSPSPNCETRPAEPPAQPFSPKQSIDFTRSTKSPARASVAMQPAPPPANPTRAALLDLAKQSAVNRAALLQLNTEIAARMKDAQRRSARLDEMQESASEALRSAKLLSEEARSSLQKHWHIKTRANLANAGAERRGIPGEVERLLADDDEYKAIQLRNDLEALRARMMLLLDRFQSLSFDKHNRSANGPPTQPESLGDVFRIVANMQRAMSAQSKRLEQLSASMQGLRLCASKRVVDNSMTYTSPSSPASRSHSMHLTPGRSGVNVSTTLESLPRLQRIKAAQKAQKQHSQTSRSSVATHNFSARLSNALQRAIATPTLTVVAAQKRQQTPKPEVCDKSPVEQRIKDNPAPCTAIPQKPVAKPVIAPGSPVTNIHKPARRFVDDKAATNPVAGGGLFQLPSSTAAPQPSVEKQKASVATAFRGFGALATSTPVAAAVPKPAHPSAVAAPISSLFGSPPPNVFASRLQASVAPAPPAPVVSPAAPPLTPPTTARPVITPASIPPVTTTHQPTVTSSTSQIPVPPAASLASAIAAARSGKAATPPLEKEAAAPLVNEVAPPSPPVDTSAQAKLGVTLTKEPSTPTPKVPPQCRTPVTPEPEPSTGVSTPTTTGAQVTSGSVPVQPGLFTTSSKADAKTFPVTSLTSSLRPVPVPAALKAPAAAITTPVSPASAVPPPPTDVLDEMLDLDDAIVPSPGSVFGGFGCSPTAPLTAASPTGFGGFGLGSPNPPSATTQNVFGSPRPSGFGSTSPLQQTAGLFGSGGSGSGFGSSSPFGGASSPLQRQGGFGSPTTSPQQQSGFGVSSFSGFQSSAGFASAPAFGVGATPSFGGSPSFAPSTGSGFGQAAFGATSGQSIFGAGNVNASTGAGGGIFGGQAQGSGGFAALAQQSTGSPSQQGFGGFGGGQQSFSQWR